MRLAGLSKIVNKVWAILSFFKTSDYQNQNHDQTQQTHEIMIKLSSIKIRIMIKIKIKILPTEK